MNPGRKNKGRLLLDNSIFTRLTSKKGWDTDVKRADAIGTTSTTIYRLRTGRNSPSADLVFDLPQLLDVDPKVLFYREESQS